MMKAKTFDARFLAAVIFIISALHFCAVVASAQQPAPWIKLERGPLYELMNSGRKATVPVPVTLSSKIKPQAVVLKLRDVRLGNRYETGLINAFTVSPAVTATAQSGPTIEIEVDQTKATAQGTYGLLIEATHPQAPAPVLLELQIVHPAAKLQTISTPVVERVVTLFGSAQASGGTMVLREVSGLSRLSDIKIQSLDFTDEKNQSISGGVSFPVPPAEVPRHRATPAAYQLTGEFPLGTSKGTVMILAPQMSEPVSVNFEIRTRRTRWLILIIIAAGLFLGYVLRVMLHKQVQLNETRLKGIALSDTIKRELQRCHDENFQRNVQTALNELRQALRARNVETLCGGCARAHNFRWHSYREGQGG